jgi:hypothetical protein
MKEKRRQPAGTFFPKPACFLFPRHFFFKKKRLAGRAGQHKLFKWQKT